MEPPLVFVVILAMITFSTAPSCGQKIEASQNPLPVGSSVTLNSSVPVTAGTWTFDRDIIVFIFREEITVTDPWISRVTYDSNTSSLTIRSLQEQDSGVYQLTALNSFTAELTLNVQEPISGLTLTSPETNLVEFNDTAVLKCSVSNGSSLSYDWMKDNSVIPENERLQYSHDRDIVTILDVNRQDTGQYNCIVSNLLGHEVSPPVNLNINYGPSAPTMTIMPEGNTHRMGSNITLSCSAESSPSAMIQWMKDEIFLQHISPFLPLNNAEESNSGNYKCVFHNTVTKRFNSASANLKIVKPIEAVHVKKTSGPTIAGEALTLTCEVTGSWTKIRWWRNQQNISADSSTVLSNETLNIFPVHISHGGEYQCEAFNEVSVKMSSPFAVTVNYGPMKPVITGPSMALIGTTVELNCSSDSFPPSDIKWYYSGSLLVMTHELTIGPLTSNMSGNYSCMAFNSVTNKTSSMNTTLTLLAPVSNVEIKTDKIYPIMNETFTLTCGTAGNVDSIIWKIDGSYLSVDSTLILTKDNATLTFNPVERSDSGNYQCIASNPLSRSTSADFKLEVIFGPMEPSIFGPDAVVQGENVTLTCDAESNPPSSYSWLFNNSVEAFASEYIIPHITPDMMGTYTCMAHNNITGKNATAHTILVVVDPILNVHITAQAPPPIEGHVYTLTCDVTGPAENYFWVKDNQLLHEDNRTTFGMNYKTVTFNPVHYNDTGKYQCEAVHAADQVVSPPFMLYVNFGPEIPTINGPAYAEIGQQVLLHCSAHSMPASHYSWWFNGSQAANTSMLRIGPMTHNMSGEYICMAHNNVTGKNSTNSKTLTVIEAVEKVVVTSKTIPIQYKNLTLTCEVTGPYDSLHWTKNGITFDMDSVPAMNMSYHYSEGNMLHFAPLMRYDDGEYQCIAKTKAMSHLSNSYSLLTNYGPTAMTIYAPDSASIGITMYMKCFADSRPDCEYTWYFNDFVQPLHTGSLLSFHVTNDSDGTYICRATNPVTKITMHQTKEFTADAVGLHTQSRAALMMMGLLILSVHVFFN